MRLILVALLLLPSFFLQAQQLTTCKVALIQTGFVWGNISANLMAFPPKINSCEGADIIVFPELFVSGCDMRKKEPAVSLQSKDEIAAHYPQILERMRVWAAMSQALVIGSTVYKEDDKYYNRLLAVFPDGSHQYYDKHNCFKRETFSAGNTQLILSWKGHKLATYICYDLRFPEWSDNKDNRYDTAIYIANWPESRRDVWNQLLRERAVENHANIIAVNCVGTDLAGLTYAGDSYILSPDGDKVGSCAPYQEDIQIVELPSPPF